LYSKSIYVLYGSATNNVDSTSSKKTKQFYYKVNKSADTPVQLGEIGEVGGREGSASFMDLDGNAWVFGGIGSGIPLST
jgi:hypothetical protein